MNQFEKRKSLDVVSRYRSNAGTTSELSEARSLGVNERKMGRRVGA